MKKTYPPRMERLLESYKPESLVKPLYEVPLDIERAYEIGLKEGLSKQKDLDGWEDLTDAIDHEPHLIDFEALNGKEVGISHAEYGMLNLTLERQNMVEESNRPLAWYDMSRGNALYQVFVRAWHGLDGFALYTNGEIPIKLKTADQLKPGTCFYGKCKLGQFTITTRCQLIQPPKAWGITNPIVLAYRPDGVSPANPPSIEYIKPENCTVIEEYGQGTFTKDSKC